MSDRRSFLRDLATLPLIGGSVAILGKPTAAAVPVTRELRDAYNQWLFYERRLLMIEQYGMERADEAARFVPMTGAVSRFHFPNYPTDWRDVPQPSTRAAVVLSAAGCPLVGGRDDA